MAEKKIHYCFTLSEDQVEHLRSKKYKIDRMECFMSLVTLAERETKLVPISKTQQVEILPGQCMVDNTQLSKLWNKDRKTVPKLLEAMEQLGISSSQKVGENRIHTLHALTGWYVDGTFVKNGFLVRPKPGSTETVHVDVPAARVITIEPDNPDNTDTDDATASKGKSTPATEGTVSSFGGTSSTASAQHQGNSNDVKSKSEAQPSAVATNGHFPQSGTPNQSSGNPANHQQTDGKQNQGAQGSQPSLHSGNPQGQPNGSTYGGYKPNGNQAPNGNPNVGR